MDKINFVNEPSGNTPLSAENLNQIQTNAENAINTKQKILTAGSNITIDENGLISAEIKTPSTNVSSALYFDNANMKLVDTTPSVAAKQITLDTDEQSIDYTLDIVTDNFVVSPTSLYNLYLALSGLSTVAGKKYIFRAEWKHGTTIISKSSTTTVEATASTELVGLPMQNNLLEENLVLNTGDTLTLTIFYETNMGDGTISILNTVDNQSAFVRNGTEVIANNVYDNFNGENHSQSYINHYLKTNSANKDNQVIVSNTEPTTGEAVWFDTANSNIKTKNGDSYEEFGKEIYSTTEVKTNKVWIDGKPIYRKVVTMTPTATVDNIAHNIANIDNIINFNGLAKYGSDIFMPINYVDFTSGSGAGMGVFARKTQISFRLSQTYINIPYTLTIEYTKTTD